MAWLTGGTCWSPLLPSIGVIWIHLQAAGLSVADRYPMSGIIAGDVAVADLARVRAVEGIAAVEEEPTFVPR